MKSRPSRLTLLLALALGWMLLGIPSRAQEPLAVGPAGASPGVMAPTGQDPAAAEGAAYSFGVVPQQSAARLAEMWVPLLQRLQALGGVPLKFATAKDIPAFEAGLAQDRYDFAYMNPYHFVAFSAQPGYHALARDRQERLQGIMVVAKDSPLGSLEDLAGQELVFPAPGAFAASLLTRAELEGRGIPFQARFVSSHDSVYLNVAKGHYAAGGGIRRTLEALRPEVRDALRVLWETEGYTPHAIAVSPRVPAAVAQAVLTALMALETEAPELLRGAALGPLTRAEDSDWDDVRALDPKRLERLSRIPAPPP